MSSTHRDLKAWQLSIELVERIYQLTRAFPDDEKFELVKQLRRAAISVPSNIAEGSARNTSKEFLQFLYIARGSLAELQTQLLLSKRLEFGVPDSSCFELIDRLFALLGGLINQIKR